MTALIDGCIERLLSLRDNDGWWRAFHMEPGSCRDWVSALAGLALVEASQCKHVEPALKQRAETAAHEIAEKLLSSIRVAGGWGYNLVCPCDSDTTAAVIRLLIALQHPVPPAALRFLHQHGSPADGYRTYLGDDRDHGWQATGTEVDCAVASALFLARELSQGDLATAWRRVAKSQNPDGSFPAYWYTGAGVATAVALEMWELAGRPDPTPATPKTAPISAFDAAGYVLAARHLDDKAKSRSIDDWIARRIGPARWPSDADLLAPQGKEETGYSGDQSVEGTGVMTAIACLRAAIFAPIKTIQSPYKQTADIGLSAKLVDLARANGLSAQNAGLVGAISHELHRDLGCMPWPNRAASAFAQGYPVEFSARLAANDQTALRFAGEAGDPGLPPAARAASVLQSLERAAGRLGVLDQMQAISSALAPVVDAARDANPDERFFLWAGLEFVEAKGNFKAALKVYANLGLTGHPLALAQNIAAEYSQNTADAFAQMDACMGDRATPQEIGFAAVTGGSPVGKIYWELDGYDRDLTRRAMDHVGLDNHEVLSPVIPGLISERDARSLSSGIAVRFDPIKGFLPDLTLATEARNDITFTPAHDAACLSQWIDMAGWSPNAYQRLQRGICHDQPTLRPHPRSLYTVTQKPDTQTAAIYVRPEAWFDEIPATQPASVSRPEFQMEAYHG